MPVEIKELVIKTSVENGSADQKAAGSASMDEDMIGDVVAQCVDQVMELLKDQRQR